MTSDDSSKEQERLHIRPLELKEQQAELWQAGISVGGGLALHSRRSELEDEERAIRSRLEELGSSD